MRDLVKFIIKFAMRILLRVFWLFPIQKKKCFFMSTMGKNYSCNPKYLYESMVVDKLFEDYTFIWCFCNPSKIHIMNPNRCKIIKKSRKLLYFYHLLTSQIIIYNCGGFSYAPIRKNQFLIETWHGAGTFKKVNLTVSNKSEASKKGVIIASSEIKLFLATSRVNTDFFIRSGMGYKGEVLNSGFPRNDILVRYDPLIIQQLRTKMGLCKRDKIVLYAPTFKGEEHRAVNIKGEYEVLDVNELKKSLTYKFGGHWLFASRGHQYAGNFTIPGVDFDLTDYPDMQELLLISDVLITDYSSSIWDFALTGKPCFLFVPDLEYYDSKERGFLTPIDSWPAYVSRNNDSLKETILSFKEDDYLVKIKNYFTSCDSYETGNATSIVKKRIIDELSHLSSTN